MTKSEKRYFKLVSSRHTIGDENNYIRLFDYLEKKDNYDEDELFRAFKGESFLNRFSITKKRLYDHILGALDSFHATNSLNAQLYKQLHAVEILYQKSLYDQARRIINSIEKQAGKNEKPEIMLLINRWKMALAETQGVAREVTCSVKEIRETHESSVEAINQWNGLWSIKAKLFNRLQNKGVARVDDEITAYRQLCQPVLDIHENCLNGTELKYLYHHIQSAYYYATRNLGKSLEHLRINIGAMNGSDSILQIEPNKRISVYTNAIYIADKIGDHKSAICYLNELKSYAHTLDPNEDQAIKLFSSISSIELSLKIRMGEFEEAARVIPGIVEKLDELGEKVNPVRRAFLYYKIAVAYVGIQEFAQARKWVNTILNDSNLDVTEDILGFTQLLDLLIQIELENNRLLPYTLKSTQRFFKTRNRMYDFEKAILNFTAKYIKAGTVFEAKELWESLYSELRAITDANELEGTALEYFDFQSWAEAKLKKKAFDLIVKEKYHQTIRPAC